MRADLSQLFSHLGPQVWNRDHWDIQLYHGGEKTWTQVCRHMLEAGALTENFNFLISYYPKPSVGLKWVLHTHTKKLFKGRKEMHILYKALVQGW